MYPKVSVILTSYNKSSYIGRAIQSVLNQTFSDFELIIVDDGSSDNSQSLLKEYEEKDNRIKVYCFEKNRGIPSAHNFGIKKARGKYCAMIDCDDFWEKEKLERQVYFLDEHLEYGACFSWINIIDEHEKEVPSEKCEFRDLMWNSRNRDQSEWLKVFFTEGCKLSNPSMVIRKDIFNEIGLYSFGLKQLQDYDLFVRLLKRYNVYVIPEKLVNYRWFMGECRNTSADDVETSGRTNFEYYLICKGFFQGISDKIFSKAFDDFTITKEACGIKRKCEEMLICMNKFLVPNIGYAVAMDQMYELLNNEKSREILEEYYGIDSSYFANSLKKTIFYDEKYFVEKDPNGYLIKVEKEKEKIKEFWYKSNDYVKELEVEIKEINSEYIKSKQYIEKLENNVRGLNDELNKEKQYIEKLENNVRGLNDELNKEKQLNKEVNIEIQNSRQYIKELEEKVNEGFGLYKKCNEYALSLEKKIREFNGQYLK